jgi:hypothetical protein
MSEHGGAGDRRLVVLAVTEWGEEDPTTGRKRTKWTRIGRAFQNRDGSTTLLLDAFPIGTSKIQVREEDRERSQGERSAANGAGRRDFETVEVRP